MMRKSLLLALVLAALVTIGGTKAAAAAVAGPEAVLGRTTGAPDEGPAGPLVERPRAAPLARPAGQRDLAETLPLERLSEIARLAIARAPAWLRPALADNLALLDAEDQATYSQMILTPAEDRFTDEIAFCVAHVPVENLASASFRPELLEENVHYIYEHDQYLEYVRLVDTGVPGVDDDYHTTTAYFVEEESGTAEYDLDPEIYYWFIVHPRLEDEMAAYVDPNTQGAPPADPPVGVFWRDWLFTYTEPMPGTDADYPILRDQMAGVDVLWRSQVSSLDNGAVGVITQWVLDILDFNSGTERPIQPVRIYELHMGRCGEHQDFTTAAARACLIPCLNTQAINQDHVWNEFWDRRWIHWEPVNVMVDTPLSYENGWGKVFSGVVDVYGDGLVWDVIDRYSEGHCTVEVTVVDASGDPVDGGRVALKTQNGYPGTWGYTDSSGQLELGYGDGTNLWARAFTDIGRYPEDGYGEVVAETEDGQTYTWTATVAGTLPALTATAAAPPGTETDSRLVVDFEVTEEILYGQYIFGPSYHYGRRQSGGSVDFFIVDAANRDLYEQGQPFEAHALARLAAAGTVEFVVPAAGTWTAVVSAERKLQCRQVVTVETRLQERDGGGWTDVASAARDLVLFPGERYAASAEVASTEPTPTPTPDFGVSLGMPSHHFSEGDDCSLTATLFNSGAALSQAPLFVLLDIGVGEYWFWPTWAHYPPDVDFALVPVPTGATQETIIGAFTWPGGVGSASGLYFYAAILDSTMSAIEGQMGVWDFGFGP